MTIPSVWPLASAGGYNRDMALMTELKTSPGISRCRVIRSDSLDSHRSISDRDPSAVPAGRVGHDHRGAAHYGISNRVGACLDIRHKSRRHSSNAKHAGSYRGSSQHQGTSCIHRADRAGKPVCWRACFFWRFGGGEQAQLDSIAVLPFVNLSNDASDYFSDGISEELLNLLTKVPGLKVAARTSSFAFKNQGTDIRDIAAQLGVATVLEGSVRWSANSEQVRITAQLIDASSGYHLWSGDV